MRKQATVVKFDWMCKNKDTAEINKQNCDNQNH